LLDTYGYRDRDGDGWREDPSGKPLVLEVLTQSEPRFVPWDELYARAFASIGIRIALSKEHGQERYKRMILGKYQVGLDSWNLDFPDGEDFYVIVWGKTVGLTNTAQFVDAEFDRLFEHSRKLLDSPERSALYRKMDRILFAQMPVIPHLFMRRSAVTQRWLLGYVPHPVHSEPWKYLDVDVRR
jgi:oligopeptide transport system substrate-binding protein